MEFVWRNDRNVYEGRCLECQRIKQKIYRDKNKDKAKQYFLKWKEDNKEHHKLQQKDYYSNNKDKIKIKKQIYASKNKDKLSAYHRKYYKENKYARDRRNRYEYERMRKDPSYRMKKMLRGRCQNAIRNQSGNKAYKTQELLGCNMKYFMEYIEKKFLPDMFWGNYGEWHIDHIIPCASFDLTNPEDQKKCFHYTNLQPLWATDNLSKGKKIEVFTSEGIFTL